MSSIAVYVIEYDNVKYDITFMRVMNYFIQIIDTLEIGIYINTKIYVINYNKVLKIFDGKLDNLNDLSIGYVEQLPQLTNVDFNNSVSIFVEPKDANKFIRTPKNLESGYVFNNERYAKFAATVANYILMN